MNDNTSTQLKLLSEENSIGRKSSAFLYDFCIGQCACQLRQAMRIQKSIYQDPLLFCTTSASVSVLVSYGKQCGYTKVDLPRPANEQSHLLPSPAFARGSGLWLRQAAILA